MKHLMLDIETAGTQPGAAILSIAAQEFDVETGRSGKHFYRVISLQSCLSCGLQTEVRTLAWWAQQSHEARNELFYNPHKISLYDALHEFQIFCNDKDYFVWGNPARFDCGILAFAFSAMHMETPWRWRNERCLLTLKSFYPEIKNEILFEGTPHNALHDCRHQIKYCSRIYNLITHKNKQV